VGTERRPDVYTDATTDLDLLAVWLKSHADGSRHTLRAYQRIGRRFLEALAAGGSNLKRARVLAGPSVPLVPASDSAYLPSMQMVFGW
jgi:hypothetical protein